MIIHTSEKNPWVVLIHGLGVSEKVWFNPLDERALFVSFKMLLKDEKNITPFAERLKGAYNILSWSQDKESTIDEAAAELKNISLMLNNKKFLILAHSRGGLVARRAIQLYNLKPMALICLSSPHFGSSFADLVIKHSKWLSIMMPSLKGYLTSIEELCTHSTFIKALNSEDALKKEDHVKHYDIYGNSTIYTKIWFINILGSVERVLGKKAIDEWRYGLGDGFVSVKSGVSPLTPEKNAYLLPLNHLNILIDNKTWDIVKSILTEAFNS
ncbi:MAG: alpha/beta hydrolase [Syntrophorhabdaceae bacterium]|nr:alpha/beta hydrolase [Syntrophorhabdaceae bacterium]